MVNDNDNDDDNDNNNHNNNNTSAIKTGAFIVIKHLYDQEYHVTHSKRYSNGIFHLVSAVNFLSYWNWIWVFVIVLTPGVHVVISMIL